MKLLPLLLAALLLSGCAGQALRPANLFKTEIDFVADSHLAMVESLLQELLEKLYRRNPVQLQRATVPVTLEQRHAQLFGQAGRLQFAELEYREEISAILLGLDPDWEGDRVFAVMTGLTGMLRRAYNYEREFFILSDLDHQRLYNSARNIEILVWRLNHRHDFDGNPLLLTNSGPDEEQNLSFERLFGKLIAVQDLLAGITADRTDRTITRLAQSVATAAFLP